MTVLTEKTCRIFSEMQELSFQEVFFLTMYMYYHIFSSKTSLI